MNDADRLRNLAHCRQALAEADKAHTPEDLARAAHELAQAIEPAAIAQGQLLLRTDA